MGPYLTLQNNSSQQLTFDVAGVPSGEGITSAIWMLKNFYTDVDNQALITLSVTTSPTAAGYISDNGVSTGTGIVNIVLSNTALNAIPDLSATYYALCRVTLANGFVYELPQARQPVRVLA